MSVRQKLRNTMQVFLDGSIKRRHLCWIAARGRNLPQAVTTAEEDDVIAIPRHVGNPAAGDIRDGLRRTAGHVDLLHLRAGKKRQISGVG